MHSDAARPVQLTAAGNTRIGSAIDYNLVGLAVILLLSVLASKVSDRFGVPALVLFLALGMLGRG